jgi:hypothetical protein
MSTQSASNRVDIITTQSSSFERFAGLSAILAGIAGLLYSISFVVLKNDLLIALFLMLGGLFSTAALVAVYNRLKETDATFALWALLLIPICVLRDHSKMGEVGQRTETHRVGFQLVEAITHLVNHLIK